jgi:NAD-dependent SIR2 family protein deacetylase
MCQTTGCCRGGRTFVCLDCKTTAKAQDPGRMVARERTNKTLQPRCPKCRKPMRDLGLRVAIPRRAHWRKLVKFINA